MLNNSRREFFRKLIGVSGLVAAAPILMRLLTSSTAVAADKKVDYVKPGEGVAAGVNYTEAKNKKKVDKKLQIDRTGVPFAKQQCSSCLLYTKAGEDGGKEYGSCTLFPGKFVKADAWCASWNKKG